MGSNARRAGELPALRADNPIGPVFFFLFEAVDILFLFAIAQKSGHEP
jgi:hypothetical protein